MGKEDTTRPSSLQTRADAASAVTQSQLTSRLEKFAQDLTSKLNAAISTAVSAAVANLRESLDGFKEELASSVNDFKSFVELSTETISLLKKRISFLENSVRAQAIWNNTREQRGRSKTFRLHNHRTEASTAPTSMSDTYDFVVLPAFNKAFACGDLDQVPSLATCAEYGHPLRPRSTTDIPSIIFRFTSRFYFNIFMKYGREVIDEMNQTRGPSERVRIGRDLSFLNRRVMSYLTTHNLTDKVRMSGTVIQFTMRAEPDKWLKVEDPTAESIADMKRKLVNPAQLKPGSVDRDLGDDTVEAVLSDESVGGAQVVVTED